MARPLKSVSQIDFSSGVNLVVNPYLVAKNQVADSTNLVLDEHGSLRTRDGLLTVGTSPITNTQLIYYGSLITEAQATYPFAIQRIIGPWNRLYLTSASPWTAIGADMLAEDIPDAIATQNVAVILNGYETPWKFDGATKTQLTAGAGQTVPPGAKHGVFHLGSLWLWNTKATSDSLDGRSSLRATSALNDLADWPNANQTFVGKNDGQEGMGCVTFTIVETGISPTATLVLFKNYSTYQVTGVFGGTTFSVHRVKSDMGCVAPRTIQFVSGFGVIRLTHKGFALYNGVEDRLISEEVRPAIFGGGGWAALNFSTVHRSWATQSQNPPLYIVACPVTGTGLSRLFVYDLVRRGWGILTVPQNIQTLNLVLSTTAFPRVYAGTETGGKIWQMFAGDTTDDGVAIDWSVKTRSFFAANQMEPAFWRRAHVNLEGPPNTDVTITPTVDGVARPTRTETVPDSITSPTQTTLETALMETAHHVQLTIAGTGPCRLRGVELHASPKPIVGYRHRG